MSSGAQLPPCPASLKSIQHYLKTAAEHDSRDEVIAYWCRLYSLQAALKIDKKSDEARALLVRLMDWLEQRKKELSSNEAITNDVAAQAHIENYALKVFDWATKQDQQASYNKNVVKAYYTSGMLMDVLNTFGDVGEDMAAKCKFAKWRAAHIHSCLKNGEMPDPAEFGSDIPTDDDVLAVPGTSSPGPSNDFGNIGFSQPPQEQPSYPSVGYPGGSPSFPPQQPSYGQPNFPPVQPPSPTVPQPASNYTPQPASQYSLPATPSTTGLKLDPAQIAKAQKYCKWASSALNYDDVPEAISNMEKALHLLRTGTEL